MRLPVDQLCRRNAPDFVGEAEKGTGAEVSPRFLALDQQVTLPWGG
jgi:hypothetical protein